jgi:hypothetical protein
MFVTIGTKTIDTSKAKSVDEILNIWSDANHDSDQIKTAKLVGYNFNPLDLTSVNAGKFTSSDVALIKVNISNAPVVHLSSSLVAQNEHLVILGFPGNAEGAIVDNSTETVTATSGVVSAIKKDSGGKNTLYQTDADISHGNSGGPAFDEVGDVIGLSTYTYQGTSADDGRKNYIRDIADFVKLTKDKSVTLNTKSTTQETWEKGLKLYDKSHYSAAVKQFEKVKALYPAHRLADSYIKSAKDNIAAGKDIKDFPIVILIAGLVVAVAGVGVAVFLIVRHRTHHHLYQTHEAAMPAGGPAPGGFALTGQLPPVMPGATGAPASFVPSPAPQPQQFVPTQPPAAPSETPQVTSVPVLIQPTAPAPGPTDNSNPPTPAA